MTPDKIQIQTREFLAGLPCSKLVIPDCQTLRDQMNKELNSKTGGCNSCRKAAIKRKYKRTIFNRLKGEPNA